MTSQIDEYFVDTMKSYADKPFCNIATDDLGLETEEEKKETEAKPGRGQGAARLRQGDARRAGRVRAPVQ